jgi:predicted transcriptional regulator
MSYQPTSRLAYEKVKPHLTESQLEVLTAIQTKTDQTNAELAEFMGRRINQITPRTGELEKLGKIRVIRRRPCRITGNEARAWEPTEPAEQLSLY